MSTLDYIIQKYSLNLADRVEIPNVGRNHMANLLHDLDFKTGVEVGVDRGYYSEILAKANPQMKVYGVDPWISIESYNNNFPQKRTENHVSQARCDQYYRAAKTRLSPYPNYKIIREYSCDAVKRFADESLNFVYIDANHEPTFVIDDISMWSKKVCKGGIVSGHDYYNTCTTSRYQLCVKKVVNDYVKVNNIKPLFIWGAHAETLGIFRDKWRSWMWIKT